MVKILEIFGEVFEGKLGKVPCYNTVENWTGIIESDFGIFKSKKSPNKLYGITPFVLLIPLYPKLVNKSVTDTFNFKERLVNVKLKDIDSWVSKNMSKNWVTERTKTLKKVS